MVKRKLSKNKYIMAGVFAMLIFFSGLLIGLYIEKGRVAYTTNLIVEQKIDMASLQTQYLYLTSQNLVENCPVLQELFRSNLKSLDTSMKKVLSYRERAIADEKTFNLLQREFIIEQVKYWLLANKVGETCKTNHLSALVFYEKKCPDCEKQQFILEYFKKLLGEDFLLFHFDSDLGEPLITTLIVQYNITEYPTTIIEGRKFEGLKDLEELQEEICSFYEKKPDACNV